MPVFQSTLATIRTNVIEKLRLDETDDVAKVNEWINLAYLDAIQYTGGFQQTGVAAMTAGIVSYDLPVQVEMIRHMVIIYADETESLPMQRVRLERLVALRQGNMASGQHVGVPYYSMVGQNQIEVWPEPVTDDAIKFWYSYLPDQLVDDADEPTIHEPFGSKLLEFGALIEGARFKKDPLITDYQNQYMAWMARYTAWLNRRKGSASQAFEVWVDGTMYGDEWWSWWERDRVS